MNFAGNDSIIHPVLFFDRPDNMTLIDAGLPGQAPAIKELLKELGLKMSNIRRLILTHQDIDHIGGAAAVVQETGAEVLAHRDDVPYIQGEQQLIKFNPDRIESMLQSLPEERRDAARRVFSSPPRVRVDRTLKDGDELPQHGGLRIVHTPGHTPGHISIFVRAHGLLVSGDALRVENGKLVGPAPGATPVATPWVSGRAPSSPCPRRSPCRSGRGGSAWGRARAPTPCRTGLSPASR